jgi:hypothetical protein
VTTADDFQLAQLNVARLRAPIDSPEIADFVALLDPINAVADAAPGFVWRLQTDEGDATSIRVFEDDMIIVNMSVWASAEALSDYVYRSDHKTVLAQRKEWFDRIVDAYLACWWIPAGEIPTVDEGVRRLELLRTRGPSGDAFTLRAPFDAPSSLERTAAPDAHNPSRRLSWLETGVSPVKSTAPKR